MDTSSLPEGSAVPTFSDPVALDVELFVQQVALAAAEGAEAMDSLLTRSRPSRESVRDWVRPRAGRYTRSLVYRDENVEVLVLTWARGARAPVHGHARQRCWMIGMAGALEVQDYRLLSGGEAPGKATLEPMGAPRLLSSGGVDSRAQEAEVHSVRTAEGCALAVSVHVYSRPIQRCLIYDVRRGRCEERRLRYDFIGPRRAREAVLLGDAVPEHGARGVLSRLLRRTRETAEDLFVPVSQPFAPTAARHHFGATQALGGVALDVRRGEFLCLTGPSGCGKSTLLQALAGELALSSGAVSFNGLPVSGRAPDRVLLGGEAGLFPWLTVRQNLELALSAHGLRTAERKERIASAIRDVQLDGFADALPHHLSRGMQMRAALARALSLRPALLLADDPFASLDLATRKQMQGLLLSVCAERGMTVVFVTHDPVEALALATRMVVLSARPARVVRDVTFVAPLGRDPGDPRYAAARAELERWMSGAPPQLH